jgi:hypothetical protein
MNDSALSTKRTFYKGTVTLAYVSEDSMKDTSLEAIMEACDSGPAIAGPFTLTEEPIDRVTADELACAYGSDAEFFGMWDDEDDIVKLRTCVADSTGEETHDS